jgi:hypothetical protein
LQTLCQGRANTSVGYVAHDRRAAREFDPKPLCKG